MVWIGNSATGQRDYDRKDRKEGANGRRVRREGAIAWLDLIEAKCPKLHRIILAAMGKSDKSYLVYMAIRILEIHRILKPAGSVYLHFRNEVIWHYRKWSTGKFPFLNFMSTFGILLGSL